MKAVKFIMEKIRDKPDMPYDRSAAEDIQVPFCYLQSVFSLLYLYFLINVGLVHCLQIFATPL
jgi:hypothetical protein